MYKEELQFREVGRRIRRKGRRKRKKKGGEFGYMCNVVAGQCAHMCYVYMCM
jgi:hypothetical protein